MGPGGVTGGTHQCHILTLADQLALLHQQLLVVAVARGQAIAMVDLDHFTVSGTLARKGHDAGSYGANLGSFLAGKVQTLVHRGITRERIRPPPEIRGNPALLDGPTFRINLFVELAAENHVFQDPELLLAAR